MDIKAYLDMIHLAHAEMLWLLVAVPVVTLTALWLSLRRARTLGDEYGEALLVGRFIERISPRRLVLKACVLTLSLALLVLALARPTVDSGKVEFPQGSVNVMAILDVSRSMAVPDYKGQLPAPYDEGRRLDMAKYLLTREVMGSLGYNRLGVVTYAGGAFPQAFVTDDMPPLRWVFDHAIAVGKAPGEGSDMARAFSLAFQMLDLDAKKATRNVIILMSDGGNDSSPEDMRAIIAELKRRDIDLIVVGLGRTSQTPIPVKLLEPRDRIGQTGLYYQVDGEVVTTRLEENYLLLLKNSVAGRYVRVGEVSDFKMTEMVSRSQVVYRAGTYEYFPWLLLGALVTLVVSLVVPAQVRLSYRSAAVKAQKADKGEGGAP